MWAKYAFLGVRSRLQRLGLEGSGIRDPRDPTGCLGFASFRVLSAELESCKDTATGF